MPLDLSNPSTSKNDETIKIQNQHNEIDSMNEASMNNQEQTLLNAITTPHKEADDEGLIYYE